MERCFGYARYLTTGAPVPTATIEVFEEGTMVPAVIYSDTEDPPTAKANPFLADANGYFFFYAEDGRYDVRFSNGPLASPIPTPYTWGDILLGRGDYVLRATAVWDPPSINNAAATSVDVTVAGAEVGMPALASLSTIPSETGTIRFLLSAYVIDVDTVRVVLYNVSGVAKDVGVGNLNVFVFPTHD